MNDNARKWVAALRSGKYKQGFGVLHSTVTDSFCCLGVACEIYQEEVGGLFVIETPKEPLAVRRKVYDGEWGKLPFKVQRWLGLRGALGSFFNAEIGRICFLSDINDKEQKTFQEIADLIESEPEGMFLATY